jgi:hypothetical protein
MDPRAGMNGCGKSHPNRYSISVPSNSSDSLYRLSYPGPHKVQRKRSNSEDSSDLQMIMQGRTRVSNNGRTKNLKLSHIVAETYG